MDIAITETAKQLMEIEKAFKKAKSKWERSRMRKEKSSHWIEMQKLNSIRNSLLIKRQKEIEEDLHSHIELSDGTSIPKGLFMEYQNYYDLTDEEMKSYIPLLADNMDDNC